MLGWFLTHGSLGRSMRMRVPCSSVSARAYFVLVDPAQVRQIIEGDPFVNILPINEQGGQPAGSMHRRCFCTAAWMGPACTSPPCRLCPAPPSNCPTDQLSILPLSGHLLNKDSRQQATQYDVHAPSPPASSSATCRPATQRQRHLHAHPPAGSCGAAPCGSHAAAAGRGHTPEAVWRPAVAPHVQRPRAAP